MEEVEHRYIVELGTSKTPKIKKGKKLLWSKESAISETEAAQATTPLPLCNRLLKSQKGKLLTSVKIKDPNYNEADTQISIYNLISVLNFVI